MAQQTHLRIYMVYDTYVVVRTYLCSPLHLGTPRSSGRGTPAGAFLAIGCTRGSRDGRSGSNTREG